MALIWRCNHHSTRQIKRESMISAIILNAPSLTERRLFNLLSASKIIKRQYLILKKNIFLSTRSSYTSMYMHSSSDISERCKHKAASNSHIAFSFPNPNFDDKIFLILYVSQKQVIFSKQTRLCTSRILHSLSLFHFTFNNIP